MSKINDCRAANPVLCRVHGNRENQLTILLNPRIAQTNLNASKKAKRTATTPEELFEATLAVEHDQKVVNSIDSAIRDLKRTIAITTNYEDKMEYQRQLNEAEQYRDEVEQKLLATSQLKNAETIYRNATRDAEASFVFTDNISMRLAAQELKNVKPGTPIAIKTRDHSYIYDTTSNGMLDSVKPNFINKALAPGFVRHFKNEPYRHTTLAVTRTNMLLSFEDIKEVHILAENAYKGGMSKFVNPDTHKEYSTGDATSIPDRWSVQGNDYYYEFNGQSELRETKSGTVLENQNWNSLNHDLNINLSNPPITVRRYPLLAKG